MDGDTPDLVKMSEIIKMHNAFFVVDEAHAVGVFGEYGCGEVQRLGIENDVFARIVTFGKALGSHGAAILGNKKLTEYLVNFARSFIYTTGLSPHALATVKVAYDHLKEESLQTKLKINIQSFKSEILRLNLQELFIESNSAIHCCIVSGNEKAKKIANQLQQKGFDVRPILSPTVSIGEERLRFCLHSYNSHEEILQVLNLLSTFVA